MTHPDDGSRPLVLLAEDDPAVAETLAPLLARSGFRVRAVGDGQAALEAVERDGPDVCVFDVLMPRMDGREALRRLRHTGRHIPVLLLTEVGDAAERAMALEEGADDYLNKPFDPVELIARIRAVLRRARPGRPPLSAEHVLRAGQLRLDRVSRRAWLADKELTLTPRAMVLLDYFVTHPDELLNRDRLLQVLWGFDNPVGTRALDNRIAELRKALGDDAGAARWIETVAGVGYRFVAAVAAVEDGR